MEETSWITKIITNPYALVPTLLLFFTLFMWLRSQLTIRKLYRDIKKLREHLHTKLEIDSEEMERRKKEMERLKQERDNLRNMVQVLNQKPGKQEIRQAHIYQKAIDIMFEKAPGFAPAWQITLKEAEEEMKNAEKGIIPFFKRFKGSTGLPSGDSDRSRDKKSTLELEDPAAS
ncbi:hypothetical protein [Desulfolithobacter sp.]